MSGTDPVWATVAELPRAFGARTDEQTTSWKERRPPGA
jgi:hypothetical protein